MVALREEWLDEQRTDQAPSPEHEGARWLSLRHASCSLNVCYSTLRRRMRKGRLPWRVVNNGSRWSYEVLVSDGASPCSGPGAPVAAVSMETYVRRQVEEKEREIARLKCEAERQEQQLQDLAQALVRARAGGPPHTPEDSPFARYRQIVVPRRRWWFF